jgi:predicted ATPase
MMEKLEKLTIRNFKSIREQTLELNNLNVLIGANGSGKSNLIQAFNILREIVEGHLVNYSLKHGADQLLFRGRKTSQLMELSVDFSKGQISNGCIIRLVPSAEDALIVEWEKVRYQDRSRSQSGYWARLQSKHL